MSTVRERVLVRDGRSSPRRTVINAIRAEGLPLKADGDQAWQDFAGWRVNYDAVLMRLAEIIVVPPRALWGGE